MSRLSAAMTEAAGLIQARGKGAVAPCPDGHAIAAPSVAVAAPDVPPSGPAVCDFFLAHVVATLATGDAPPTVYYAIDGDTVTLGASTEAVSPPPPPAS